MESRWEKEWIEFEVAHLGRERKDEDGIYYYILDPTGKIVSRRKGTAPDGSQPLGTGEHPVVSRNKKE